MSEQSPFGEIIFLVQDTWKTLKNNPGISIDILEELNIFIKERLNPIFHRHQTASKVDYVLAFVGITNAGKSTLMEAVLGGPIAPRRHGTATAVPVQYRYAESWSMTLYPRGASTSKRVESFGSANELGARLSETVLIGENNYSKQIGKVVVTGPIDVLKEGLVLADTPGFGSAESEVNSGFDEQMLKEFLVDNVDRVYFCISTLDLSISPEEVGFYKQICAKVGCVVLTKWVGDADGQLEYQRNYKELFPGAVFVFTNAKRAMSGASECINQLKEIIEMHATPERRRILSYPELCSAWEDINESMKEIHKISSFPWRKDSLQRFAASCANVPELSGLYVNLKQMLEGK